MAVHGEDGAQAAAQAAAAKEAATAQLKVAANGGDEEKARAALAAGADVEAEGEVGWGDMGRVGGGHKVHCVHDGAKVKETGPRLFACTLTSAIRMDPS